VTVHVQQQKTNPEAKLDSSLISLVFATILRNAVTATTATTTSPAKKDHLLEQTISCSIEWFFPGRYFGFEGIISLSEFSVSGAFFIGSPFFLCYVFSERLD
jgi:hypothetical protein